MNSHLTRRKFLMQAGLASLSVPLFSSSAAALTSFFVNNDIKFGYSAITWGGNDVQAIKDISSLGFTGIQLRANSYPVFKDKPEELKKMLGDAKLELAMFSSGNADINTGKDEEQ